MPSRVRLRGDREAWEAHLAENKGKKLKPHPDTEAKALAVRIKRQEEREMAEYRDKKKRRKMTRAARARVEKKFTTLAPVDNGPFRANKSAKHAMELLDDTFAYLKMKPPVMNTSLAEPWTAFLVDCYAKVAKWPEAVLEQFVEELTAQDAKGKSVDGLIKLCKQIIDYTFNAPSNTKGPRYNARWKMWPHQRDREQIEAANDKENLMASKLAAKKKKGVDKVSAKKGGKAKVERKERSGGLILLRANNKLPDGSDRQKKAVSSVPKDGVLMSKHAKEHGRMIVRACIKHGFLKTKAA